MLEFCLAVGAGSVGTALLLALVALWRARASELAADGVDRGASGAAQPDGHGRQGEREG